MLTWAPAQDYRQPGMLLDVVNAFPTNRGFAPSCEPAQVATATPVMTVECQTHGISVIRPDRSYYAVVGNGLNLHKFSDYADLNRAAPYTKKEWCFAPTTSAIYAVNGGDELQKHDLDTLTAFTDVANCPRFS